MKQNLITILDAKAATGVGNPIMVGDYENIIIYIATASSANLTVNCQGSIADESPTWGDAASVSNKWDYVEMKNLQSGEAVDGDTGVAFTGTDGVEQYILNTSGLEWVNFVVTARSAGSVSVFAKPFNF